MLLESWWSAWMNSKGRMQMTLYAPMLGEFAMGRRY